MLYRPDPALLDALLAPLEADGLRVLLYANGPPGPEAEARLARAGNARVIRSDANAGLGAGLNALMRAAAAEGVGAVLLLDQDSTPPPGLAGALAARLAASRARGERPAAVGPRLVPPAGSSFLPIRYAPRPAGPGVPAGAVDFLPTSGTLVGVAAWAAVGPFREGLFIDGIDVDWGFRAWAGGRSLLLAEDLAMDHRWGVEDAAGRPQILRLSPLRAYYYLRNAAHGLRGEHLPGRWRRRSAARLAAQALLLALRATYPGAGRLALRALRDGAAGRLGPAPDDLTDR